MDVFTDHNINVAKHLRFFTHYLANIFTKGFRHITKDGDMDVFTDHNINVEKHLRFFTHYLANIFTKGFRHITKDGDIDVYIIYLTLQIP
jgi:flagellar basal body rod protein FlgG